MRAHRQLGLVALILLALLPGCAESGDGDGAGPAANELAGRSFSSTAVEGRELAAGTTISLGFEADRLTLQAGCNTITAPYELDDGRLELTGEVAVTMIGCPAELQSQDEWLAELIGDSPELRAADGDRLTLDAGDTRIEFKPAEVAKAPPVAGTTWRLDRIAGTGADAIVANLPAGIEVPTLRFDRSGQVELFTGCNQGGGEATIGSASIDFGPLRLTRKACAEPAAVELERQLTALLQGEVFYAYEGADLVLSREGEPSLVFTAG